MTLPTKRALFRRYLPPQRAIYQVPFARLRLEPLEDRTTPSTTLAPPTLLDPVAAVRVDQVSYQIVGKLQEAAKNGTAVLAYRDSNHNGVFDTGDALAGATAVAMKSTAFSVSVPLQANAANQFFIFATDGKNRSAVVKVAAITEDSIAPTVTGITRVGPALTNAGTVQFQVAFSEPVAGVDAGDFQVASSGSLASGAISVSGSGASYTVTVSGLTGQGTLGLNLIDNDSIHDILTKPAQDHPLGGVGVGNGNFTAGQTYSVDRVPPTVSGITALDPALTNAGTVHFQVAFSEPVTGVADSDFALAVNGVTGAAITGVAGSGSTYTVTVNTGSGSGTVGLGLTSVGTVADLAGNPLVGTFTAGQSYAIDRTPPTMTAIDRVGSIALNGRTAAFTVTFSEPVSGVNASDFALAASGFTGAAVTGVTGSGSTYTVTVDSGTGSGSLGLNLNGTNTIDDLAGNALSGTFTGGQSFLVLPSNVNSLATVDLPALNINLLGLHVQTSEIIVSLSANAANGQLLGNLLTTASNLINLQQAADALNQVLGTTVGLLNTSSLGLNLGGGTFDTRPVASTSVLSLQVAPVHLDLLGALVNTNPIDVTITAESGPGQILGNIVYDLSNLFNALPGQTLNIDTLNQELGSLLGLVNTAVGLIPPATVPTVQPAAGQVLSLTVPALDLNLLGLNLQTTPITVNADAQQGSGALLGNVLTSLLNTLDATPANVAQLNNTLNAVLARVVGVLNAASLTVPTALVNALPPALQTLLGSTLVAPAGSTAPILDLVIASPDGTSPPVDVNLLGLNVTTSNINARLSAVTGDGQILGNLLYNVANLANPNGAGGLLSLLNALGAGNLNSTAGAAGGSLSGTTSAPQQLLKIQLNPIDLNLLGLEVKTDPIVVTLSTQGGDGQLLGNLLGAVSTLVNFPGVGAALNNALGTVVNLVNSTSLSLPPGVVGGGTFDTSMAATTPVLDAYVAPVHLDLLGLLVDTQPIHVTITAHAGVGLVLGNVVSDLAHLFDNPPATLTVDAVNAKLGQLLAELNAQIPNVPAASPPVMLGPDQFLELTVPPINLNLLGLLLKTSPITVNAFDQTGNGDLLGNFLNSLLNTVGATPGNLTVLSQNLNALLSKVVGVLNAAQLTLPPAAIAALPPVVQTLLSPVLISPTPGATSQVLDLTIASPDGTTPPVQANLLGLQVTTSNIDVQLWAQTGDGQVLGNLLYNVSNLLNQGNTTSLLLLLSELSQLA